MQNLPAVGPGAADAWLTEQNKEIWEQNPKVYGARRVHTELRLGRGINVSKSASGGSRARLRSRA